MAQLERVGTNISTARMLARTSGHLWSNHHNHRQAARVHLGVPERANLLEPFFYWYELVCLDEDKRGPWSGI